MVQVGGSQRLADALASYLRSLGGAVETGRPIDTLDELPAHGPRLLDVTPRELLRLAGPRLPGLYRCRLGGYRYGPGVFKLDWALDGPIPWRAGEVARAGTVRAYCHVPSGSARDMTAAIEGQVERFAPGFRERVLERSAMGPGEVERRNPNYVGGDINAGVPDLRQLFTRPVARPVPYSTPLPGVYLCSSSTPPGGGVHGMSGYWAARGR